MGHKLIIKLTTYWTVNYMSIVYSRRKQQNVKDVCNYVSNLVYFLFSFHQMQKSKQVMCSGMHVFGYVCWDDLFGRKPWHMCYNQMVFPLNGILCEYLGAYLAPVRLLPTVYPHMSLKVTWCYWSKLTQCAPVWPLPCVSHHVSP